MTEGQPNADPDKYPTPYPYRAALAFLTDIDATTLESLFYVHRLFCGLGEGYEGVNIDLTNSYWVFSTPERRLLGSEVSLVNSDLSRRPNTDTIGKLLASPMFDTLHTYGDINKMTFDRDLALKCVDLLAEYDLAPKLWTFHGNKLQVHNIGPGAAHWEGDDPQSQNYHLDILQAGLGTQFFRISPSESLDDVSSPLKVVPARDGTPIAVFKGRAFVNHTSQEYVRSWLEKLRADEATVLEDFRFFKPSHQHADRIIAWMPEMLHLQLSDAILSNAVENRELMYVNQHLTRDHALRPYEYPETKAALRRLSDYQAADKILTCSPSRLLMFEFVRAHAVYDVTTEGDKSIIRVEPIVHSERLSIELSRNDLSGVAISIDTPEATMFLGDTQIEMQVDRDGEAGCAVAFVPWVRDSPEQAATILEYEKYLVPA